MLLHLATGVCEIMGEHISSYSFRCCYLAGISCITALLGHNISSLPILISYLKLKKSINFIIPNLTMKN